MRIVNLWSLILLLAVQTAVFGAECYQLQVVVQTGDTTPTGNTITELGSGPSINDAGKIAYKVRVADGREGIYVSGESSARSGIIETFPAGGTNVSFVSRAFYFDDLVQINNRDQVINRIRARDGLMSFLFRLGSSSGDTRIVAKTQYVRLDSASINLPSPFCGPELYPWTGIYPAATLNNEGRTVFSAILCGTSDDTVLATPRNVELNGHNTAADFFMTPPLANVTNYFPQVADNGVTVIRDGSAPAAPIVLYDPTFDLATSTWVAHSGDFSVLGEKPGTSDSGRFVAFMGVHKTTGVGIYGALIGSNKQVIHGPFKITDSGAFSTFFDKAKVGVNLSRTGVLDQYTVTYIARGTDGLLGLYVTAVDITNPMNPEIASAFSVLKEGDTISGLSGSVRFLEIYDPINNGGQLAFWVSTTEGTQAIVHATPSFFTVGMYQAEATAIANRDAGTDIDAPLVLAANANALAACDVSISIGLVADGVTPLLIKVTEQHPTIAPTSYRITLHEPVEGGIAGGLAAHLLVLQGDAFVEAGSSGAATVTIPKHTSPTAEAFAYVSGIRTEDVILPNSAPQISCSVSVQPLDGAGNPTGEEATVAFKIRKPPIVLIHGFNSDGAWSDEFKNELHASRTSGFVYELRYGISYDGSGKANTRDNTYDPLIPLAILLDQNLRFQIEGSGTPAVLPPWGQNTWALTRYDVVAHSQGGVLTRMLCTESLPWDPDVTPFRGPANFYRGRFRRIVTVGSPQNGTSLLHYLIELRDSDFEYLTGFLLPKFADYLYQAKFDPWAEQIPRINRPGCEIDPTAKFHAIRAQVLGTPLVFRSLFLHRHQFDIGPNFGKTGQEIVLPRGSDTIVDMASQEVNTSTPGSLYDEAEVAHAPVDGLGINLFGTMNFETTYGPLAEYIVNLLDNEPHRFGSFILPANASDTWRDEIDAFVQHLSENAYDDPDLIMISLSAPTALKVAPGAGVSGMAGGSVSYDFALNESDAGSPVPESVNWYAEVLGPSGVSIEGLILEVDANNPASGTLTAMDSVVGDVVLYVNYTSTDNKTVMGWPVVVTSRPVGTVLEGISLVPAEATLAIGDQLVLELWAQYENGKSSRVFVGPDTSLDLMVHDPAVIEIRNGRLLIARSAGTSTITAVYNGFINDARLTVSSPPHFVTTIADPSGGGTVAGGRYYREGTNATVTASAHSGYLFSYWTENGEVVSTSPNYTFTVTEDRHLTSHFVPANLF